MTAILDNMKANLDAQDTDESRSKLLRLADAALILSLCAPFLISALEPETFSDRAIAGHAIVFSRGDVAAVDKPEIGSDQLLSEPD